MKRSFVFILSFVLLSISFVIAQDTNTANSTGSSNNDQNNAGTTATTDTGATDTNSPAGTSTTPDQTRDITPDANQGRDFTGDSSDINRGQVNTNRFSQPNTVGGVAVGVGGAGAQGNTNNNLNQGGNNIRFQQSADRNAFNTGMRANANLNYPLNSAHFPLGRGVKFPTLTLGSTGAAIGGADQADLAASSETLVNEENSPEAGTNVRGIVQRRDGTFTNVRMSRNVARANMRSRSSSNEKEGDVSSAKYRSNKKKNSRKPM